LEHISTDLKPCNVTISRLTPDFQSRDLQIHGRDLSWYSGLRRQVSGSSSARGMLDGFVGAMPGASLSDSITGMRSSSGLCRSAFRAFSSARLGCIQPPADNVRTTRAANDRRFSWLPLTSGGVRMSGLLIIGTVRL
jgi:hypothetical protein